MKNNLILAAVISALLISCNNKPDVSTTEHDASAHQHNATHKPINVTLNNGQKWEANTETTEGIKNMQAIVRATSREASAEDYHSLQSELDNEFANILKRCTMQGEAHNQLHNYLLPIKDMIEKLGIGPVEEREKVLGDLEEYLKEYPRFFQ